MAASCAWRMSTLLRPRTLCTAFLAAKVRDGVRVRVSVNIRVMVRDCDGGVHSNRGAGDWMKFRAPPGARCWFVRGCFGGKLDSIRFYSMSGDWCDTGGRGFKHRLHPVAWDPRQLDYPK